MPSRPSVAVGISGGVDSSVAALLLKVAGFDVRGVFMRNWDASDEAGSPRCTVSDDLVSARAAAEALGIPLTEVDFVAEYWSQVFEPFLESYSRGVTPNPDVSCNRFVKFGAFREHCLRRMGADFVALGHYATVWPPALPSCEALRRPDRLAQAVLQHGASSDSLPAELRIGGGGGAACGSGLQLAPEHTENHATGPALLASVDGTKDQSDFLCRVPGASLKRVILPLGQLHKSTVRQLAAAAGLPTAGRKDSYGICFIGKRDLTAFLGNYVPLTPAEVRSVETGALVSRVDAAEVWTVGQRMPVGGTPAPLFVAACDLRGSAAARTPSAAPLSSSAAGVDVTNGDGGGRFDTPPQRVSDGPISPWARKRTLKAALPRLQIEHLRAAKGPVVWVAPGTDHPALLADAAAVRLRDFFPVQGQPLAGGAGGSDGESGGGSYNGDALGSVTAQAAPPPSTLSAEKQRLAAAWRGVAAPAAVLPLIEAAWERKLGQSSGASSSTAGAARCEDSELSTWSCSSAAQRHREPMTAGVPSSCGAWLRDGCSALAGPEDSPAAAASPASLRSLRVRYRIRHQQMAFQRGSLLVLWASEWRRMVGTALMCVHAGMTASVAQRMRLAERRKRKGDPTEQRALATADTAWAEAERKLQAAAAAEAWALLAACLSPQLRECLPSVAAGSAGATTLLAAVPARVEAVGSSCGSTGAEAPTPAGALPTTGASVPGAAPAATDGADELLLVLACEGPQRAVCPGQELVLYSDASVLPPPPPPPPQGSSASAGSAADGSLVHKAASSPDASPPAPPAAAAVTQPAPDAGRAVYGGGPIWSAGPTVFTLTRAATFNAGKLPAAGAGASVQPGRDSAVRRL
jgi:tRNA-specific 2-thiouridylase